MLGSLGVVLHLASTHAVLIILVVMVIRVSKVVTLSLTEELTHLSLVHADSVGEEVTRNSSDQLL